MKLVDLVEFNSSRLRESAWLERLSLPKVRNCFCLMACVAATATVSAEENSLTLFDGSSVVLPPALSRSLYVKTPLPQSFVGALFFEISPQDQLHGIAKLLALKVGPEPPGGTRHFFNAIYAQLVSGSAFTLQAAAHQASAFLYTLAEETLGDIQENQKHAHIEKALELMHLNSNSTMSLRNISSSLRLSEAYFVRLFKKSMYMPPMKYFTRLKIHNAALLLMQGLTVKEVAERLGFYSESHFSKQFKRYMGVPPKNYKVDAAEALQPGEGGPEKSIILPSATLPRYIDSVCDMVFIKDTAFIYRGCNTAFCRYVGKDKKEIFGHTDFTLFSEETAAFYREKDERIFATRRSIANEEWITYPSGERKLVEVLKSPYFDPNGELLGIIGISRDITGRSEQA
jgi:PAS domain S-box-containing protein